MVCRMLSSTTRLRIHKVNCLLSEHSADQGASISELSHFFPLDQIEPLVFFCSRILFMSMSNLNSYREPEERHAGVVTCKVSILIYYQFNYTLLAIESGTKQSVFISQVISLHIDRYGSRYAAVVTFPLAVRRVDSQIRKNFCSSSNVIHGQNSESYGQSRNQSERTYHDHFACQVFPCLMRNIQGLHDVFSRAEQSSI